MILLDAYALVALIADEPAADPVEEILRAGDSGITTINLAEALDVAQRARRLPSVEVRALLEPLAGEIVRVVTVGEGDAWRAAELRLRHYHRKTSPLSMADCFLVAAAGEDDSIATADPSVAAAARAEGVELIPLPDSTGRLPW